MQGETPVMNHKAVISYLHSFLFLEVIRVQLQKPTISLYYYFIQKQVYHLLKKDGGSMSVEV